MWPSWHSRPQAGSGILAQNITKQQIPLVTEEYLNDAINKHDWKMFPDRMTDLIGDATFMYAMLQAARCHQGYGSPREWPPCLLALSSWAASSWGHQLLLYPLQSWGTV